MLINFCNPDLVQKISCTVIENEGYSVDNLISKVELNRAKGFLADYFIKPPLTVEFQFLCEIELSHVILWPRIGSQKTTGVELLSRTDNSPTFNSIGCAFLKDDEDGFIFCRHGSEIKFDNKYKTFRLQTFKSSKFLRAKDFQVRILKTHGSSVPALHRVEIWGKLPRYCSKQTANMVISAWNKINKPDILYNFSSNEENNSSDTCFDSPKSCNENNYITPNEFLDPITCEIMSMPMIMPSGNIIDNLTLEKFIKEEEKWGRLPSDPFTGKRFSLGNKPTLSIALKTRIDKFLFEYCNEPEFKNLPRSLGSKSDKYLSKPVISSLVSCRKFEDKNCVSTVVSDDNQILRDNILSSITLETKDSFNDNRKRKNDSDKDDVSMIISKKPLINDNNSVSNFTITKFDEMKKTSLENILKDTLSTLTSYVSRSSSGSSVNCDKIMCSKCNSVNILYILPCNHYICRECLSSMNQLRSFKCSNCSIPFNSLHPKRIHVMTQ